MTQLLRISGTAVALKCGEGYQGVLLRGPSGSGKSDLALRLIDRGALLIADDLIEAAPEGGKLIARAPQTIRGRMEVRGVGIVRVPCCAAAPLALLIDLVEPGRVARLPPPAHETLAGIALPRLVLSAFEISAAAKIGVAVQALMSPGGADVTFPFVSG